MNWPKLFQKLGEADHFKNLDSKAFTEKAGDFIAELNAIHPFREGNGRSQLAFLAILADVAGSPLALERLDAKRFLSAMVLSFKGDNAPLIRSIGDPTMD